MKILKIIFFAFCIIGIYSIDTLAQSDISECKKDCLGTCNGNAGICNGICVADPANCNSNQPPTQNDPPDEPPTEICPAGLTVDCAGICGGSTAVDCEGTCGGSKEVDNCGICGGNDEDLDLCGVCNGDGTSCGTNNNSCPLYSFVLNEVLEKRDFRTDILLKLGSGMTSCFNNLMNSKLQHCVNTAFTPRHVDNCLAQEILKHFNLNYNDYFDLNYLAPDRSKTIFFNSSCQPVNPGLTPVLQQCSSSLDFFVQFTSPISLIWDESYDLDNDQTIKFSNFKLDLSKPGYWHVWKASDKAPLLVYDPEHTGKINDATQLFGEWTFGGKKQAYLNKDQRILQSNKWKDGFEALATLDKNGDEKLTGGELGSLGLWFDANRDGKSDKGEVKSIKDLGVVSITVKPNRTNQATGSIIADAGYKKFVDKKIIEGKVIDWYGRTSKSYQEMIFNHQAESLFDGNYYKDNSAIDPKTLIDHPISGAWKWEYKLEGSVKEGGILTFSISDKKGLIGHSYAEINLSKNEYNINSAAVMAVLSGEVLEENEDIIKFKFSALTKENKSTTLTYATYNKKTKAIEGRTNAKVNVDGSDKSMQYNWIASKLK